MTTRPDLRLTSEEYLQIERAAEWKSEYLDGEMFARAGASPRHVLISGNLIGEFGNRLRETPCTVYSADLRVATNRLRHYTYPDVVVACEPLQFVDEHRDTITNPTLIAEVLSDSTESTIAEPNSSELREWNDPSAEIELSSLRCRLKIAEVYAKVTFDEQAPGN